jgi:phage terminase large subunit
LQQSSKRLIEDLIKARNLSSRFRILESHIVTPGDGIFLFQGMKDHTADSIKSLEGYDVAWVEEAQALSQRSLDLLRPTIRKSGSEMWFSWNPRSSDDPIEKFFCGPEGLPPGGVLVVANYYDNPFFSEESRLDMEYDKKHHQDKYDWVWLGQYERHSEAHVFKVSSGEGKLGWRIEEFTWDPKWIPLYGGDWGFAADPTVLVKGARQGRRLFISNEVWAIGCPIDSTPRLFDLLDKGEARKHLIVADSARPETIDHLKRNGYPHIEPSFKGPNSVEEGVSFLQNLEIIVHPRCEHVIDELRNYKYKVDPHTDQITPIIADENNHTIDPMRYMLEPERHKVKRKVGGGIVWAEGLE